MVKVHVKFMESGIQNKKIDMHPKELKKLLMGAKVTNIETFGCCNEDLHGLTLKLKDGSICSLNEENNPSWEGSSEGRINIFIDRTML